MTDYSKSPEYLIIKYLWSRLVSSGVLSASDYYSEIVGDNLMPFIPLQQQAETNAEFGEATFFVYETYTNPTGTDFFNKSGELTLFCFDNDFNKIVEVRNLIEDELGRKQSSAADVNTHANLQSITLKTISVESTAIDKVSFDDDGRQAGEFIISFTYTRESSLPSV